MPSFDVTTLGEVMVRLSVPPGVRLESASRLDLQPGGAEANLVALLARLGRATAWLGALPDQALGRLAANHLRAAGVDLGGVAWCAEGRMGSYYVEFAGPPRPIQVIYDRADSCAARLQPEQVEWSRLLDTRLLHLTGITPALTPNCHAIVAAAIQRARGGGIPISFDVNYREKLWSPAAAAAALAPLMAGVHLLFCAHGDAVRLFGCAGEPGAALRELAARTRAQTVIMSVGDGGVLAWDGEQLYEQQAVPVALLDRLGAGDALAAGVIHGWLDGDLGAGLRYGVTLAALALSQHGDMVVTTAEELRQLAAAPHGGVRR